MQRNAEHLDVQLVPLGDQRPPVRIGAFELFRDHRIFRELLGEHRIGERGNADRVAAKLDDPPVGLLRGHPLDEQERRLLVLRVGRYAHGETARLGAALDVGRMQRVADLADDLRLFRVAGSCSDLQRVDVHGGVAVQERLGRFAVAVRRNAAGAVLHRLAQELRGLHAGGAVEDGLPLVVEDAGAHGRGMEQPGGRDLVAGLAAHGEAAHPRLLLDGLRRLADVVVGPRHGEAQLLEHVLAIGEDRGLGAERQTVERARLAGQIALLAADDAAVLDVGVGDVIDIVVRVDERGTGEELREGRQQALRHILALPHHHPGDDVEVAVFLAHLQKLAIPHLEVLGVVDLDLDPRLLGELGDQLLGLLEVRIRGPADHQRFALVFLVGIGHQRRGAERQGQGRRKRDQPFDPEFRFHDFLLIRLVMKENDTLESTTSSEWSIHKESGGQVHHFLSRTTPSFSGFSRSPRVGGY